MRSCIFRAFIESLESHQFYCTFHLAIQYLMLQSKYKIQIRCCSYLIAI